MAEPQQNNPAETPAQQPVQNPILIPDKGKEKKAADLKSFYDDFSQSFGKTVAQKAANPYSDLQPFSYNPKSTEDVNKNFEHFYTHSSYKNLGFNPWSDNESLYNAKGSSIGDVGRAAIAAQKLAWVGFQSPIKSYADIFSGDLLAGDPESAEKMRYINMVGSSSKGGATGFTANLITNSGFTLGFMGEAIAEQAVLTGLNVLTGGGATGVQAIRAAKTAKDWGTYTKVISGLSKTASALDNYPAAKTAWDGFKATAKFFNPFDNTVSALNNSKNLTGLARASNTAAGFFRDVSAANFTLSESKIEGSSAALDTEESLIRKYKDDHGGMPPSYDEILRIKDAAKAVEDKTLAWNIPAIYLTNKLTFAPLFRSFTSSGENILKNGIKFVEKDGKELVKANLFNSVKSLKPSALYKIPITYFKENLSEGIQESTQDVISNAAKDYYTGIYNTAANQGLTFAQVENQTYGGVWDAVSKSTRGQFSGRGFETFASGFLMGGLLKVAGAPISAIRMGVNEYRKGKKEYTARALEAGNALYQDPLKWFSPTGVNYSATAEGVVGQDNAENSDDQKLWSDFDDHNTWSHLMTALNTGTYDIALEKLKSIKTMSPEAIEQAYPGVNGQAVLGKIDKLIGRAEGLKKEYETINAQASNPFNPKQYELGTAEYNEAALGFVSWEAAKKTAIFQKYSFKRNEERIESMAQDILRIGNFNKLASNDISLLFHPNTVKNELRLLDNELEVLDNSIVPGDRTIARQKRTKQAKLNKLLDNLEGYYLTQSYEKMSKEARALVDKIEFKNTNAERLKNSFEDYISHLGATQANVLHISKPDLNVAFQHFLDIHDLKQENIHFAQAIDLMANPQGFIDHYKRMNAVFTNLYAQREEIVQKSVENTQKKIEDNLILKALYDRGFVLSPENAEKFIKDKIIPTEFYDINAKQVVNQADPIRYAQFKEIIENYVEATKSEVVPEDAAPEAVPVQPEVTKPSDQVYEPINIDAKLAKVRTGEQLQALRDEVDLYFKQTHFKERGGLESIGLSNVIAEKLRVKEQELLNNVTIDNLKPGNIVLMTDDEAGKAIVIRKTNDFIVVETLDGGIRYKIAANDLKKNIKSKFANMKKEEVKATPEELGKTKQNAESQERVNKNSDLMKELVEEALKDKKAASEVWLETIGCN